MIPLHYTDPELLTTKQVMSLVKIGSKCLDSFVKAGLFPGPIFLGNEKRWIKEDVIKLVNLLAAERDATQVRVQPTPAPADAPLPPLLETIRGSLLLECPGPGIYFLLQGTTLIYLGCSINPEARVNDHRAGNATTSKKDFDRVYYLSVGIGEIFEREKLLIMALRPTLNIYHNPGRLEGGNPIAE